MARYELRTRSRALSGLDEVYLVVRNLDRWLGSTAEAQPYSVAVAYEVERTDSLYAELRRRFRRSCVPARGCRFGGRCVRAAADHAGTGRGEPMRGSSRKTWRWRTTNLRSSTAMRAVKPSRGTMRGEILIRMAGNTPEQRRDPIEAVH